MIRTNSILFALLLLWPASAAAVDAITLDDGSVLKGKIKRIGDDKLTLDTSYADDVEIEVKYIVGIDTGEQFTVRLLDGELISGFLSVDEGRITLSSEPVDESHAETSAPLDETAPEDRVPGAVPVPDAPADVRRFSFDGVDWVDEKQTYFRYEAEFNAGVNVARGNTDTTDLHLDTRFEPTFGLNTLRLIGEFDKKEADGDTTTDRWLASLEYEREIGRRWFIGASNSYEADKQRDLELRIIAAAGVGYHIFDEDPTHLSVMPAVGYVIETFEDSADDDDYVAFRWKLDFSRDLYKDDISFYHNHSYLNNLQKLSDIVIETRSGFEFDLAWDLKLSAEFQTIWDNEPATDADELDTRYILKIGYEFEGDQNDWFQ